MSLKGLGSARHLLRGKINHLEVMALSAYDIAVKNGYTGTEEEWLLSLQGGAVIDKTLSIDGVAADAKATGEAIRANANGVAEAKQTATKAQTTADKAETKADNAQTAIDNHKENKGNPHNVTAVQLGLGNANNTSDMDKPVSTKQAEAIADAKKAGTDAQTAADNAQTSADNAQTAIDTHKEDKENPHGVTAAQVGATTMSLLWENASPTSKFTAQTIALNLTGYDFVEIECWGGSDHYNNSSHFTKVRVGCSSVIGLEFTGTREIYEFAVRDVEVTDNGISFSGGGLKNYKEGWVYATDGRAIPYRIYGIKGVTA